MRSLPLITLDHYQFSIDHIFELIRLLKLISGLELHEFGTLARCLITCDAIECWKAVLCGETSLMVTSLHTGWLLSLLRKLLTISNG